MAIEKDAYIPRAAVFESQNVAGHLRDDTPGTEEAVQGRHGAKGTGGEGKGKGAG